MCADVGPAPCTISTSLSYDTPMIGLVDPTPLLVSTTASLRRVWKPVMFLRSECGWHVRNQLQSRCRTAIGKCRWECVSACWERVRMCSHAREAVECTVLTRTATHRALITRLRQYRRFECPRSLIITLTVARAHIRDCTVSRECVMGTPALASAMLALASCLARVGVAGVGVTVGLELRRASGRPHPTLGDRPN